MFDHQTIEKKWQDLWKKNHTFEAQDEGAGGKNQYILFEFPYPSGNLHIGHWYAFAVPDIYVRYKRMLGHNVLYPVGFDAFGLPAENAAIKHGKNPQVWTKENIEHMSKQLRTMGASFDWSREIRTCDPKYYTWTQWLFLQLFKNNLAYQSEVPVNWCPSCQTVLANEQVIQERCERCDHEVEQKNMNQWLFRITKYANQLIDDLEQLSWPEEIKESQRNWIGRSEGAEIEFSITNQESRIKAFTTRPDTIFGATYMVLAPEHQLISKLKSHISNWNEVETYINQSKKKTEVERTDITKEKTGIKLKGITTINPANQEEMSVWIADYVIASYGTGAIMAVPSHDERDFEFAKKFNLPIKQVIMPETGIKRENEEYRNGGCGVVFDPQTQKYAVFKRNDDFLGFFSGGVEDGEDMTDGILREIEEESGLHNCKHIEYIAAARPHYYHPTKKLNRVADAHCLLVILENTDTKPTSREAHEQFELHWATANEILENLQRRNSDGGCEHWIWFLKQAVGRAIEYGYDTKSDPSVFKETIHTNEGIMMNSGQFSGLDSSEAKEKIINWLEEHGCGQRKTTYRLRDWLISRQRYWGCPIPIIHCKQCGVTPVPEKDLPVILPEDVDFTPTGESPLASSESFHQVTCPKCGTSGEDVRRESDTMDTFVDSSWYFLRYCDPQNTEEFASSEKMKHWMPVDFYSGGAEHTTMHLLYSRFFIKAMHDLSLIAWNEPYTRRLNRGLIMGPDGQKMSKSRGNVIDPDENVKKFGADTVRTYLAFIGPYNEVGTYPWDMNGIIGIRKFLERIWKEFQTYPGTNIDKLDDPKTEEKKDNLLHQTIKKVTEDIEKLKFNTAISQLMILTSRGGLIRENPKRKKEVLEIFLKLLHPFAPHITEELWEQLSNTNSIVNTPWPTYDEKLAQDNEVELVIQINGKVRDKLIVSADISEKDVKQKALASKKVQQHLNNQEPKKIIIIKRKLVNIVI